MASADLIAIWISLRLATTTTLLLLLLARRWPGGLRPAQRARGVVVDALVSLPLVLPPTVLGFYLLLLLAPRGALGAALRVSVTRAGVQFTGLVIGSMVYSLPFAVQPLRDAFEGVGARAS